MNHIDHVTQHETVRSEPFNSLALAELSLFGWILIRGRHKLLIIGPLYSVMVITPAKDVKVPSTFAIPWGFRRSRTSNPKATAIMKVREAMLLTMEEINVGEVYFKLAKYIFRVKLTLQFHTNNVFIHVYTYSVITWILFIISPYPKTESTKNSIKRENVSFGLTFLQEKRLSWD